MEYLEVARFKSGHDPSYLGMQFSQMGISHKIQNSDNGSALLVRDRDAEAARKWLAMASGQEGAEPVSSFNLDGLIKTFPGTLSFIFLGIVGYALFTFPSTAGLVELLTFTKGDYSFSFSIASKAELWRIITPIFLHFSFWHILFNGLAMWELGRRVEYYIGSKMFIAVCLAIAIFSNCMNYIFEYSPLFGGLSGVICGLLGMVWVFHRKKPLSIFYFPKGAYIFAMVWLFAGVLDLFSIFNVQMANTAHFSGLFCGAILGYLYPIFDKTEHVV